jgi:membrane associated rhomboid family serine protease
MPSCPVCRIPLRTVRQRDGVYFFCDQCGGRAVTVPQIRRAAGDRFATQLLREINRAAISTARPCPFCEGKMRQFQNAQPPLTLDSCRPCGAVWFDAGEFEAIPEGAIESTDELLLRGREAMAAEKVKQIAESASAEESVPEEKWKWLAALFGMPVELDAPEMARLPWLTWSLSAIIALVSILAFFDLQNAVDHFGLIPSQAWRCGGFTFISSFFLHAGIWHLVSNLYFFLVFGDNVEDYLGPWKFACLILVSALGGDILALLFDPRSDMPSVGASGGISGVLAFYALQFPKVRLAFFLRFCWLRIPAWGAFALWVLLQVITAIEQVSGMTQISGLAHLGGVAVGFVWWLKWGDSMRRSEKRPRN